MSSKAASIFISHASRDRGIAATLCAALEHRGLRCWLASRDIAGGDNFQSAVVQAIRSAKVMLLVFTANANNSEEIKKELVLASQSRLVVIPLRVQDVVPGDAFAYEMATRQWIDMVENWEQALEHLTARISMVLPVDREPEAAPDAAVVSASTLNATAARAARASDASGATGMARPPHGRWRGWIIGGAAALAAAMAVEFLTLHQNGPVLPIGVSTQPRAGDTRQAPPLAAPVSPEALKNKGNEATANMNAATGNPYEGAKFTVHHACDRSPDGVDGFAIPPYGIPFIVTVTNGIADGQYLEPGAWGSFHVHGPVSPTGSAQLRMSLVTADPDYTPLHAPAGTKYDYPLVGQFNGRNAAATFIRGDGKRTCRTTLTPAS